MAHRGSAYRRLCCKPGGHAGRKRPGFERESYRRVGEATGGYHGPWNSTLDVGSPHSDYHSSRSFAALDRGRAFERQCKSSCLTRGQPCREEHPVHCFGSGKRATVGRARVIAAALLQLLLLEPTHAADAEQDECDLASVNSTQRGAARKSGRLDDHSGVHRVNRRRGPHDSGGPDTPQSDFHQLRMSIIRYLKYIAAPNSRSSELGA